MISIDIKPEDIDRIVNDAILKSMVGDTIQKIIAKLLSSYNNPVEEVLKATMKEIMMQLMREKYAEQLRASITTHLAEKINQGTIDKVVDTAVAQLRRDAESGY